MLKWEQASKKSFPYVLIAHIIFFSIAHKQLAAVCTKFFFFKE